jgi:hypothetical protein
VRERAFRWLALSLAVGVVAQVALLATDAVATRLHLPWLKNGDVYHRTLGWRSLGEQAGRLAQQTGARAIAAEQRDVVASLLYYWRDRPQQIRTWPGGPVPAHQFEITHALNDASAEPVLFVSPCPLPERLAAYYAKVEPLGSFATPMGPTTARTYYAFKLENRRQPLGPLGACAK